MKGVVNVDGNNALLTLKALHCAPSNMIAPLRRSISITHSESMGPQGVY